MGGFRGAGCPFAPPPRRRPAAQALGINLIELEAPFSDRLISEGDAATVHQPFDIAEGPREAKVEPD